MNWLKILVGLSAILVAGCAAYFSVTGLGVLFAGASLSVMIMAGALELAKLVAATYLKQEWDYLKGFNKWYLTISVGTLMLITSAGIFGYLSNAFQQQNLSLQKVERDIAVYQTQIEKNDGEIARYTTQLTNQQNIRNSQEANISKVVERNGSTSRLTQMVRNADKEITSISKRIDELTKQNNVALDSINSIKNNNINLEREVGGFRFVADAFGVPLNQVVKFFIFVIVLVFDPLAIALIIAFNGLLMKPKRREEIKSQLKKESQLYEVYGDNVKEWDSTLNDGLEDEEWTQPNEEDKVMLEKYESELKKNETNSTTTHLEEDEITDEHLLSLKTDTSPRFIDLDGDGTIDGIDTDGDGMINKVTAQHPNRAMEVKNILPYYARPNFNWNDRRNWINDQNAVNYWIKHIKPSQYPTDFTSKSY
jgi:hypothetical protein